MAIQTVSDMKRTKERSAVVGQAPQSCDFPRHDGRKAAQAGKPTWRGWRIPAIVPVGSDQPVSRTLPRVVKRIVRALKPEKVILFGSYAYGSPTSDSDVDLLVIWDTVMSGKDRYLSVSRLIVPRPFAVDLIVRTPQEVERALAKGDPFLEEITSRGKVLYERSA